MVKAFDPYVLELERLAADLGDYDNGTIAPHLDGEAGRRLRSVVEIEDLRAVGAFFTGEALANRLLDCVPLSYTKFADAAAGCGDLLLAACERLPIAPSLEATLRSWNEQLVARDLVPQFVRAARARVALSAIARGARPRGNCRRPLDLLFNIAAGDGTRLALEADTAMLLNPPYGRVAAPVGCRWSSGLTTEAGIFIDRILTGAAEGAYIAALLPEVIRAGARYRRLRDRIEQRLDIELIEPAGVFDALTDVDVFILAGTVKSAHERAAAWTVPAPKRRLDDICTVGVGAVVAGRDPKRGPSHLYLDARSRANAPEVTPTRRRRYAGRVLKPPFVVVGRTNRPVAKPLPRVRATIIRAEEPVAVENHLITLVPDDHTLRGCRKVVGILQSPRATRFLDARLRCRHLTVSAVREIPR